jgi:hypothetical protein
MEIEEGRDAFFYYAKRREYGFNKKTEKSTKSRKRIFDK